MNMAAVKRFLAAAAPDSLKTRHHIIRNAWIDGAHRRHVGCPAATLPTEASRYLCSDNPKLLDLQRRYSAEAQFTHTFWKNWRKHINLAHFRGEGHYLEQGTGRHAEFLYFASTVYLETIDDWNLLDKLREDDLFGCHTFSFPPARLVSRDLLDSILELYFLRKALSLNRSDNLRVLDIGAGYGRFAHRFLETFAKGSITNVDGVPESTFLCDFYTRFRGLSARSQTLPVDELNKLNLGQFDVAANIHSWSECPRETVRKWVTILRDLRVPLLFVVPHDSDFSSREQNGSDTFLPEITRAGYREIFRARKFSHSETLHGLSPVLYVLFSLKEAVVNN
jgi:SAM-dependent methyltransferase